MCRYEGSVKNEIKRSFHRPSFIKINKYKVSFWCDLTSGNEETAAIAANQPECVCVCMCDKINQRLLLLISSDL